MDKSSFIETLDQSRMRLAVEEFAGGAVRTFTIVEVEKKTSTSGICGEYALPHVEYVTEGGAGRKAVFFVRRQREARRGFDQEHHYRRLPALGLQTPRMYGAWLDGQGREVLVLEPVDIVEADHNGWLADERNCRAFLSLMARFASLRVPTDYVALIGRDMAYRKGYTRSWNTWLPWSVHILGRVWEHALRNELGRELKAWCGQNESARSRLQESARAMLDMTGSIPQGVIHGDCHPGNVGRRKTGDRELVLFDFEDVMIDFLLYDVALFLGAPDDMYLMKGAPVEDLAEYYLKELRAYGGNAPTLSEFLRDARLIWHTRKLNLWEHLPEELGGPSYLGPEGKDTREERQSRLLCLLKALAGQLPIIHFQETAKEGKIP